MRKLFTSLILIAACFVSQAAVAGPKVELWVTLWWS